MGMKWSIRNKLLAAFGALLLMFVILVVVNWSMMSNSIQATELARDKGYAGAMLAAEIKFDATQVWQWLTDISATRAAEGFDDGFVEAEGYAKLFRQNVAALREIHPDNHEQLDQLSVSFEEFYEKGQWMAQQYIEGGPELGNVAMEEFDTYGNDISTRLDALVAETNEEAEESIQAAVNRNVQSQTVGLVISGISIVLAVIISLSLARSITTSVDIVARAATGIARGDLDQRVEVKSKDELGNMAAAFQRMMAYMQQMAKAAERIAQGDLTAEVTPKTEKDVLGNAFQQMMANLRNLIGQVQQSADQVASASQQLNASAEQASQAAQQVATTIQQVTDGTTQQTQSVTEATVSIEQIAHAADGIARGSQEQAQGIQKTSGLITEMASNIETVAQTGQGMETIRSRTAIAMEKVKEMGSRSKEIGRIVNTIDDIADKTDMLALNAAVEAARAGEHGRGFAVVADQVRKLSEDSKNATQDIGELIERVQEAINEATAAMESTAAEVDKGTGQISEAVSQLKEKSGEVVAAIESVSTVVEENTAAAEEMAANSQEVTTAMEGVASIAEENSASAEEVSASAEEMSAQTEEVVASAEELAALAEQLREATALFRVDGTGIEPKRAGRSPKIAGAPISQQQPEVAPVLAGHQDDGDSTETQ